MGMLTGLSIYVLGTSTQRLVTVNYYDWQGRTIQQISDNHLGQVDVVNNQYNFTTEVTGSQRTIVPLAATPYVVKDRMVYDQSGRLMDTYESFQGGAEIDISHNVYNEISQKVSEGLNSYGPGTVPANAANITENAALAIGKNDIATNSVVLNPGFSFTASSGNSYLAAIGYGFSQTQEFRYNIKRSLTNINNGTLTYDSGVTQSDPNALFGESITYWETSPLSGTTPQYSGNLSGITWRNKIEATGKPGVLTGGQGYNFSYDNANRLTQTGYYTQTGSSFTKNTANALTEQIKGYDEMGNIDTLQRKGMTGSNLNNLTYTYQTNGNQLLSVRDVGSQSITGTFTYDGNGNMVTDSKKGITVTYNYLDLPDTVKQGSSKLVFTYDAAGNKLYKQLITSGTVVSQRHYIEEAELVATSSVAYDGHVESIAMPEGRIVDTGANHFQYEYFLQDHLYNNRVTFRVNTNGTLKVTQVQNYYPFGADMGDTTMNYTSLPTNLYKYSDKELQTELNLNTYDFGARHYNPVLGRWVVIDPMAEASEELSPYNFVENNPMNLMDPDGMQTNNGGLTASQIPFSGGNTPGGSFGTVGSGLVFAGALLNGAQALNAFNINRPVAKQDWTGLKNVQGSGTPQLYVPQHQSTVVQWQPGFTDRFKNSNPINNLIYSGADDAYIAVQTLFWPFGDVNHISGVQASDKDRLNGIIGTITIALPIGKDLSVTKAVVEDVAKDFVIKKVEGEGVYDLETTDGRYVGQSQTFLGRVSSHFKIKGKLNKTNLINEIYHDMPGSTKLEREVYEQYLIREYHLDKLINIRNPMGGRMKLYHSMIEDVIKKFNLPR
jgi:RHS repeat-associated protein